MIQKLLVGILLYGGALFTQSPLVETFSYPSGVPLAGQGDNTNGWAGPWQMVGGDHEGTCTNDTLVVPELLIRSQLPVAYLASGPQRTLQRNFSEPRPPDFWFAFLSRQDGVARAKATLAFVDTAQPVPKQVKVEFGKTFASTQLISDGIDHYPRATGASYPTGHWTVGQFLPESDTTALLYLWIDPDPQLPPDPDLADQIRRFSLATFDAIQLLALDRPGVNWWIDDFYLAENFMDIVPPDWTTITLPEGTQAARDGFDYPIGNSLAGSSGGYGFAQAWEKRNNFDHEIVDATLEINPGLDAETPAAGLFHQANGQNNRYLRKLATPYPDDGSTYWVGALMDVGFSNGGNVAQVYLAESDLLGPSGPNGQLLLFGKSFQDDRFSLGRSGDFSFLNNVPVTGTHWTVLQIATTNSAAPDTVRLWIDPDPQIDRPPLADVAMTKLITLNNGWDALGAKVEGNAGVEMVLDELAIGNRYRDVVPPYLIVSVADFSMLQTWSVFPNPGNGTVHFKSLPTGTKYIDVFDAVGKWHGRFPAKLSMTVLNATDPTGPYYLLLSGSEETYSIPYLKSH